MTPDKPPLAALSSWARDRFRLAWPLRACVLKFIRSYQETPGQPRPFVGRAALLDLLDEWLTQTGSRVTLLSGAAGRGKSALLLHWLGRLIQAERAPTVLYLPLSIRFSTADEATGIQLLFAALCDVFSELPARLPQQPQAEDFLQGIAAAWQQLALESDQAFLLVVDGLDEAVNQWFVKRRILPADLPPNLHVLLAARHTPGIASGEAWLADLNIQGTSAQALQIGTLEREALAEAIVRLGHPLEPLAEREAFVASLHRLTDGGDPLLLTLWLGEIWRQRDALPALDPAALGELSPGFGALYRLWRAEQQALWEATGLAVKPDDFKQVMHVLATAQGRLLLTDLVAVLGFMSPWTWDPQALRAVLASAHRLVVGDETGYVLVHPRLAQHFRAELAADPPAQRAVHTAFRDWGADTVRRLNSGALPPEECPAYLLTHYVAAHLDAGEGSDAAEYLPLLQAGWAQAWHVREGAWQGYLHDLGALTQRLQAVNQGRLQAGDPPRLAVEVRCALLAASLRSLISSLPRELLVSLAREGVWSLARAARVARQYAPRAQAECLIELAELAAERGAPAEAACLWQEAVAAAGAIPDEAVGGYILATMIVPRLTGEARRAVLEQTLQTAVGIPDEFQRAATLQWAVFPLQADDPLLEPALAAARAIQNRAARAGALATVAAHLAGETQRTVLQEALQAAAGIVDDSVRAETLCAVAGYVQDNSALLQEALTAVTAIPTEGPRAAALSTLASLLLGHGALLGQALAAAAAIEAEEPRARVLGAVAEQLQADGALAQQAQAVAAAIKDPGARADALSRIAEQLPQDAARAVWSQALEAAARIPDAFRRALALGTVAAHLAGEARHAAFEQLQEAAPLLDGWQLSSIVSTLASQSQGDRALLQQALTVAAAIADERYRADSLRILASHLEGEPRHSALKQALQAAATIPDQERRVEVLGALVADLATDGPAAGTLLQQALQIAAAIQDPTRRAMLESEVAAQLDGAPGRAALEQQAAQTVAADQDPDNPHALLSVAENLDDEEARRTVLQLALKATVAIRDESEQCDALRAVAARLPDEARCPVLQQAQACAGRIRDPWLRALALQALSEAWPGETETTHSLRQQAVEAAVAAADPQNRALTLQALAEPMQGEARCAVLREMLRAVAELPDEGSRRAQILCTVATPLRDDSALLQEALEGAAAIQEGRGRAFARSYLATLSHEQAEARRTLAQQALAAAAAAEEDESFRAFALGRLAARLTDRDLLPEVLELIAAIGSEWSRAFGLEQVAPRLRSDSALLQQALTIAAAIQDEQKRSEALSAVAAQLEDDSALVLQALRCARGIGSARHRAHALGTVALRLHGDTRRTVLEEALEAARAIGDGRDRAISLSTLAGQLEGQARREALDQALAAVATISDLWQYANALESLADQGLQDPQLSRLCLKEVLALPEAHSGRIAISVKLVRQAPALLTYELWCRLLHGCRLNRASLLSVHGDLAECAVTLTGRTAEAAEIACAIHEVCEWLP